MSEPAPIEFFPSLSAISGLKHAFLLRVPSVEVTTEKSAVLSRLDAAHAEAQRSLGLDDWPLVTAQQVHGGDVAVVTAGNLRKLSQSPVPEVDGFATALSGVALGIYVADCCAVYIVDPAQRALALVHSGKKGSEANIAGRAIETMAKKFGSNPGDLVIQLSPCIRPPAYEIDFAARIRHDCSEAGVRPEKIHDSGQCTSADLDRYYSYRIEKGKTGRMLALLGWEEER